MEEDNTRYIAEQIFSKSPGEENSINLQLDESTVDFMENEGYNKNRFIQDIISMITLHGVQILFGHKNVRKLTEDQIFLIKQYTRSYGFNMILKADANKVMIEFEKMY
jgi:hypothetical protein